jgi:hypothetical protein
MKTERTTDDVQAEQGSRARKLEIVSMPALGTQIDYPPVLEVDEGDLTDFLTPGTSYHLSIYRRCWIGVNRSWGVSRRRGQRRDAGRVNLHPS